MTGISQYDVKDLYQDAFGTYAKFPVYILGDSKPDVNPTLGSEEYLVAPSGALVWDRFGFRHPKLIGINNYEDIYYMPVVVTAEVSDDKNIVTTDVVGKSGTVKELMGDGDKLITFRGLVINSKNEAAFPEQQVRNLNKLFELKASVPIVSKYLNNCHNIHNVVFTRRQWLAMEGYANVIKFEFTALSDTEILLDLQG